MDARRIFLLVFAGFADSVQAHCPLCVAGAAAAAGGAKLLGVNTAAVALFLGAFAMALGFVLADKIKKTYLPFQNQLIIMLIFATTIGPLLPILGGDYVPFSIFLTCEYGSLFHTTYVIDLFLFGSIIGGAIILVTPSISKKITKLRGDATLPFQGLALTLVSLLLVGIAMQMYM